MRLEEVDRHFDFFSLPVSRLEQNVIVAGHLGLDVERIDEL